VVDALGYDPWVIVTFNTKDFVGSEKFGLKVITPPEFLRKIGDIR
jgi:hypothetical protein